MDPILIYVLVGTFTPGPNNILSSSTSSRIGILKTLPFMFGVLVGTFIVFTITGIFNVVLFEKIGVIKQYVGYIGAFYMAYLAFKIATSEDIKSGKDIGKTNLFFKAILLTFINPKAIVFGLTVTGLYFRWGINLQDLLRISLGLAVLCFLSVLVWGFLGYLFMRFLSKYQKIFNIAMASLLLFSAILILFDTV